jgi:hypothetical protein
MLTSTVLSLLFVPVSYIYFDGLQRLLGRLFTWRRRSRRGGTTAR